MWRPFEPRTGPGSRTLQRSRRRPARPAASAHPGSASLCQPGFGLASNSGASLLSIRFEPFGMVLRCVQASALDAESCPPCERCFHGRIAVLSEKRDGIAAFGEGASGGGAGNSATDNCNGFHECRVRTGRGLEPISNWFSTRAMRTYSPLFDSRGSCGEPGDDSSRCSEFIEPIGPFT